MSEDNKKSTTLAQVVRGVEQLSDAKIKEQTRWYIPSAIERLAELCNSNNEAVSLGAIKVLLAKNLPDLKATELTGEDGGRIKLDVSAVLEKVYGPQRRAKSNGVSGNS
jgi:hypothetical protein